MGVFLVQEPRCVFIHLPKTGGASIRHGFFKNKIEGPTQGHVPDEWNGLFKFAFVRNPYDRIISAWKMFASGMEQTVWEHPQDEAGIDLHRFLEIVTDESIPFDGARKTTHRKIRHHGIPQTHPYNCLQHADYIGRFENLAGDFQEVCKKIGIDKCELPHWNRTDRSNEYMQYFDNQSLSVVNEFFAEDFSKLEYKTKSATKSST